MNAGKTIAIAVALWVCCGAPAQADSEPCVIEHPHPENGATIVATMFLINDGQPCVMRIHFSGNQATSLTIRGKPSSGVLSSTRASVSYTPDPGFVGKDSFDVQWFGSGFGPNSPNHNVRTKVDVTVRVASDEPEAKSMKPAM